jgi:hypothetical protein
MYTLGIMSHRAMLPILILSAGATLLHAQAMIEYGVATGRGGAAAGAAAAGKSAIDVFGKVNKALVTASKSDDTTKLTPGPAPSAGATAVTAVATKPQPPEPVAPPDLTALVAGMDRADMLKKVGKPSMSLSGVEDSKLVETCWYRSGADNVTVTLRDGKVATISGADKLTAK